MAISPKDIEAVTGEKQPEREAPKNRIDDAAYKLDDLNGRMAELVGRERQAGESHAQAYDRVMRENGGALYAAHKRASARILRRAGVDDAACGGV